MHGNQSRKTSSMEFFVDEEADMLFVHESFSETGDSAVSTEVLRLSLESIRKREPAEIQRLLGGLVLAFLDSRSSAGLDLPRDFAEEKRIDDECFNELRSRLDEKYPETVYDLAIALIGKGTVDKNWSDIEQGELLLGKLIKNGWPDAIKYEAEVWSCLRPYLERKIKPN